MAKTSSYYLGYNRQLDGLRAFAVFFVLWEHWFFNFKIHGFNAGKFGVYLFFVISGYLITGILLKAKHSGLSNIPLLKTFYIRRFLRIFPLYYLVLLIAYLLNFSGIRQPIVWHSFYLTNFYGDFERVNGEFGQLGSSGHFWSLSVEEQFYLFWPFLIILIKSRYLVKIIIGLVLFTGTSVFWLQLLKMPYGFWEVSPLGCLHLFGAGALLNFINPDRVKKSFLLLLCVLSGTVYYLPQVLSIHNLITNLFIAPFLGTIVLFVIIGIQGRAAIILSNKVIVFCGTISYGIYLIHPFVNGGIRRIFTFYGYDYAERMGKLQVPLLFLLTILIATGLYYLFERPIMNFKKYFNYGTALKNGEPGHFKNQELNDNTSLVSEIIKSDSLKTSL